MPKMTLPELEILTLDNAEPCRHCGGRALATRRNSYGEKNVWCRMCGLEGPRMVSFDNAVIGWNNQQTRKL